MNAQPASRAHPAEQLLALTARTLWLLYAAFWLALIVYAAIALALPRLPGPAPGAAATGTAGPGMAVSPVQILLLVAGAGCLLLAVRIGQAWLRPERLWAGAQSLEGLAAHLAQRGGASRAAGAPGGPGQEARQQALARAVQHLLGRIVMAHVVPWVIAEAPALLGLLDRFLSGSRSVWPVLMALCAAGLVLRRPARARLREVLDPIYRAPLRGPASG